MLLPDYAPHSPFPIRLPLTLTVAMPIVSATHYSGCVLTNFLLLNAWLKVVVGQQQTQGVNHNSSCAIGRLQYGPFWSLCAHFKWHIMFHVDTYIDTVNTHVEQWLQRSMNKLWNSANQRAQDESGAFLPVTEGCLLLGLTVSLFRTEAAVPACQTVEVGQRSVTQWL